MPSVARLVSFWRCIPMQYNCQKSSNFQGLSHFSRIFGKNDKIPGFFQAGKTVIIFPGFPGAVGTLQVLRTKEVFPSPVLSDKWQCPVTRPDPLAPIPCPPPRNLATVVCIRVTTENTTALHSEVLLCKSQCMV